MRDGLNFPMRFPLVFFEWLWRDELPPHPKSEWALDHGRGEYERLLAGRPARIGIEYMHDLSEAALGRRRLADTHWAIED